MRTCSVCDKNLSMFDGKKIFGQGLICKECMGKVPKMSLNALQHLTDYDIKELISYASETAPKLRNAFLETASYGTLHIDEINGLFAVCDKKMVDKTGKLSNLVKDVYSAIRLTDISLTVVPDKEQKNPNKVKGTVKFVAVLSDPQIHISTTVREHVYCNCYPVDDTHIGFDEPNELVFFKNMFNQMLSKTYDRYKKAYEEQEAAEEERRQWEERMKEEQKEKETIAKERMDMEYIKAKAAFMLEDGYTEKELKMQRNRLLKTFHPDEGQTDVSSYTQNINKYYQILMKHLEV